MTTTSSSESDYRLPRDVAPRRYELRLAPDLEAAKFTGTERVEIEVLAETSAIICNADELEIDRALLLPGWSSEPGGSEPQSAVAHLTDGACAVELDAALERVTFRPASTISPGRYTLEVDFAGTLNDKLVGFYRSTFVGEDGTTHTIATTQFEETDARRAFPCFDEPDRKAVFSITLDIADNLTAISNAREIAVTEIGDGRKRVVFADTISMSTYLVAFVVGPLVASKVVEVRGVPVRVIHTPGKEHLTEFALECGAHALTYFSDYYGIPYPGDKYDLVGIPDFQAGAMENLGCVTFREAYLLVDPSTSSTKELERVAEVIAHETAHMWFGDLVTMAWWNGIWLNEAFATYMASCAGDDFHPEWKVWETLALDATTARSVDGLHSTRPVEYRVVTPDDAAAMFDVLTYEKGGSVLRMLETYLGTEAFREGVRHYLETHQFANTETTDLWDAIEAVASDIPVRAMMDSWIFQGGYPLLEVARDRGVLTVSASPFSYLSEAERPSTGEPSGIGSAWLVPLQLAVYGPSGETTPSAQSPGESRRAAPSKPRDAAGDAQPSVHRQIVSDKPVEIDIGTGLPFANAGGNGFYRVAYASDLSFELAQEIGRLAPLERLVLVSDTWATALSGRTPLAQFIDLARHLETETNPNIWSIVVGALDLVSGASSEEDGAVRELVTELLSPQLERVGWQATPSEDSQTPALRSTLIRALGQIAKDRAVIAHCRELFLEENMPSGEPKQIPADIASAVLSVVAASAGRAEFDMLLNRYHAPLDPQDERRYLLSLAFVGDATLASQVRELCRTEFRTQDGPSVLATMMAVNRSASPATWQFLVEHFDALAARFPEKTMPRLLGAISGLYAVEEDGTTPLRDSVQSFVSTHPFGGEQRLVNQALERLEINVRFVQRERETLHESLARRGPS